jgi:hypothetical protein
VLLLIVAFVAMAKEGNNLKKTAMKKAELIMSALAKVPLSTR